MRTHSCVENQIKIIEINHAFYDNFLRDNLRFSLLRRALLFVFLKFLLFGDRFLERKVFFNIFELGTG